MSLLQPEGRRMISVAFSIIDSTGSLLERCDVVAEKAEWSGGRGRVSDVGPC